MKSTILFGLVLCLLVLPARGAAKLELRDGDRVAFVGGVFMEREQDDGYIETMLTLAEPDKALTFRNFGWGGDTVESHLAPKVPARPKYVPSLFDYLEKYQPSVVFISYGMMESFRGEDALPEFVDYYNQLISRITAISNPRIVLVSPFQHEALGGHFPDPEEHNRLLRLYVDATGELARKRGAIFVNLFDSLDIKGKAQFTSNGVHLNSRGYREAAEVMRKLLGLAAPKIKLPDFETVRSAIRHKNKQWWFHYRPMNSEYVYPGGTRYQNELGGVQHPMFSELEAFAKLAEKEDQLIRNLLNQWRRNEPLKAPVKPSTTVVFPNPPDPEAERKTFTVAEEFEVNLFAADPKITKPVQMAFDQKGRLWVATTTLYPQIKPGEEPSDSIIILEDLDGDGRADKTTTFADGLVIPTGVLPWRDGAFVFDDTTLLFLRDSDGDGRADTREVVLSGFGTEDSHHKGHVLRWGPEGRLHFNVGVFLHNNIETAHGLTSLSGYWQPGIFAYDPLTGKLDVHLANSVPPNPWGHYWNRWGFDFHIDSSGQQGSNLILPTSRRTSSAIPVPGGEGKLAGGEIISGRHLPESWQGNLISAPFKENRVARWEFSDDGSGYALKPMPPLIVSTDPAFRPVDERMGPDGAIYISDWYNPLIGHMQHHFRDPGRDFTHGRIWRVTAKDRPLVKRPKISGASIRQLLEHLKAPEDYTRQQARRELAERDSKEVIPALRNWVKKLDPNDPDFDHHRVEALWVFQTLKTPAPALLRSVLAANDPNARAAAVAVLRDWRTQIPDALSLLGRLVRDNHPRVRLQAVIALSYFEEVRAVEFAMNALDLPTDRYIEQALKNTVIALRPYWEPALTADTPLLGGNPERIAFLLKNAALEADPKVLIHLLRAGQVAPGELNKTIASIVNNGAQADLEKLYAQKFEPELQAKVLAGMTRAARERKIILSATAKEQLGGFLKSDNQNVRINALRLAGAWQMESYRKGLETVASDPRSNPPLRQAAFDGLVFLGGAASVDYFRGRLQQEPDPAIRQSLLNALVDLDLPSAADIAAELLQQDSQSDVAPLFQPFLQRKNGSDALAAAIRKQNIHPDNAKLGLRFLQKTGRQDEALFTTLNTAAGFELEAKDLSRPELERLAREVLDKGDPARGELVFRRPELSCFQCHAISGAGGRLGPDLSAVGSGSAVEYLIESLLNPNKIIKDGFETVEIVTNDDEYLLGVKVRENPRETVLKDAGNEEIVIPATFIREKNHKPVSLMPAGLTATLTHTEFLDLCRFLAELGKPGPYANNPNPVVRRWRVVSPAPAAANEPLPWQPAYSFVSGHLPLSDLSSDGTAEKALLKTEFEVTTPGRIQFHLNSIDGLTLAVNGNRSSLSPTTVLDLPRGTHTVFFEVDLKTRQEGIRMEFDQVPGSAGRFQLPTGP